MRFKKLTSLLLLFAIILLSLTSCGMTKYEHEDIGLTITLPEDFERSEYGAKEVITYENLSGNCAVVINNFTYTSVMNMQFGGKAFTLQDYVNRSLEEHGISESIKPTYPSETRGVFEVAAGEYENETPQYSYNVVIMECGRIYVVQMLCLAVDCDYYRPKFEKWAEKIKISPVED